MKLEFKLSDCDVALPGNVQVMSVEKANARLREMLDQAPRVYGEMDGHNDAGLCTWGPKECAQFCTHQARLVDIREGEK